MSHPAITPEVRHIRPVDVSALTRVNRQLKAQAIPYQLVRGRGYYYLRMLDGAPILPATAIYTNHIGPEDYAFAASEVRDLLKAGGITATFTA